MADMSSAGSPSPAPAAAGSTVPPPVDVPTDVPTDVPADLPAPSVELAAAASAVLVELAGPGAELRADQLAAVDAPLPARAAAPGRCAPASSAPPASTPW